MVFFFVDTATKVIRTISMIRNLVSLFVTTDDAHETASLVLNSVEYGCSFDYFYGFILFFCLCTRGDVRQDVRQDVRHGGRWDGRIDGASYVLGGSMVRLERLTHRK